MKIETTPLSGLLIISPQVFADERGWFLESYNIDKFAALGIHETFVQDNHSRSIYGTLRGFHFQTTPGQSKLIRCTQGRIWDVAVDIRPTSATFGKWNAVTLDAVKCQQVLIPVGFAHGFCVLSETAEVQYKCSNVYNGATEAGIAWDDPDLDVKWPIDAPLLSKRDLSNQSFKEYCQHSARSGSLPA